MLLQIGQPNLLIRTDKNYTGKNYTDKSYTGLNFSACRDNGAMTEAPEPRGDSPDSHHGDESVAYQSFDDVPFDDVLARRSRLKRITSLGQRIGYSLYLGSLVLGAAGVRWGYTPLLTTLIAVALVVGSMLLAPTIVMSHGIKAAEREERK